MQNKGEIHIGTSGWHYGDWEGRFYPEDMSSGEFLEYYSQHFQTVELNNSFYNLPDADTVKMWRDTVPDDFTFAVKASRYMTHMKKLKDPEEPIENFFGVMDHMGDKLGPVLFQIPPNWNVNAERLDRFCDALPTGPKHTFEFRNETWFCDAIYEILRRHNAALCIYDMGNESSPKEVTADFTYVRMHGASDVYEGKYNRHHLSGWVGAFNSWVDQGLSVYCYFNNDVHGYAVDNAMALREMIGKE